MQIGDRGKVVRHAMGRTESWSAAHFTANLFFVFGLTTALIGGGFVGMGYAMNDDPHAAEIRSTATVVTGVAAGVALAALPILILTRPVRQEGSMTEIALGR